MPSAFEVFIANKGEVTLKTQVDKLDDVPEALRPLYVENGGKHVIGALDDIIVGAAEAKRKELSGESDLSKAQARLSGFLKIGSAEQFLQDHELAEQIRAGGGKLPDVEEIRKGIKAQLDAQTEAEKVQLKEKLKKAEERVEYLQRTEVYNDLLGSGDLTEAGKKLFPMVVKDRIKLRMNDAGQMERIFLGEDGSPLVNAMGELMRDVDFHARLRQEFGGALYNDRPSGAAVRQATRNTGVAPKKVLQMAPADVTRYIKDYGEQAYREQYIREIQEQAAEKKSKTG